MAIHNASSTTLSLSQKRRFHSMKCEPSGKLKFLHETSSMHLLHDLITPMKKN